MSLLKRMDNNPDDNEPKDTSRSPGRELAPQPEKSLKQHIHHRILVELDPSYHYDPATVRQYIADLFDAILVEDDIDLPADERTPMLETIIRDMLGYGPLDLLLEDEDIEEIHVLNFNSIYATRRGQRIKTDLRCDNEDHLLRIIDRIVAPLGKGMLQANPITHAYMPDGSSVTVRVPPVSLAGASMTIHKSKFRQLTVEEHIQQGTLTTEMVEHLRQATQSRSRVVVAGANLTARKIMLTLLGSFIPDDRLIVAVQGDTHVHLTQPECLAVRPHQRTFEEGKGRYKRIEIVNVTTDDLVHHALSLHADHIIISDLDAEGCATLLRTSTAWMAGLQSLRAEDALLWLNNHAAFASPQTLADSIDLLVFVDLSPDIGYRISSISEIHVNDNNKVELKHLDFHQAGMT